MNVQPAPVVQAIPVYVYVAAQYQGMAPPPGPPCLDLLPWEEKAKKEAEAKQKAAIQAQQRAQEVAEQKKKTGFFNQLTAVVKDVAYQSESAITSGVKSTVNAVVDQMDKGTTQRFHAAFPQYTQNEKLLHHSSGKIVSGGAPVNGDLYISEHFVSFKGEFQDRKSVPGQTVHHPIVMSVPIATIVSLQPAAAVFGVDKTAAPMLQPIADAKTLPTALMLYANDHRLHLLYGFTDYSTIFNVLDHYWRSAVNTNMLGASPLMMGVSNTPMMMSGAPMMMTGAPMMMSPSPVMTSGAPMMGVPMAAAPQMPMPSAPPADEGQRVAYPTLGK